MAMTFVTRSQLHAWTPHHARIRKAGVGKWMTIAEPRSQATLLKGQREEVIMLDTRRRDARQYIINLAFTGF